MFLYVLVCASFVASRLAGIVAMQVPKAVKAGVILLKTFNPFVRNKCIEAKKPQSKSTNSIKDPMASHMQIIEAKIPTVSEISA
jgi:hypothetical protein